MNVRWQLYKKYRLSGMSAYKAARAAGYSHATAWNAHKNIEKRCNFEQEMVKNGLDNATIMKVLGEGLSANRTISAMITPAGKDKDANGQTCDFIDVPDHATRHKYLETMLKLKGQLQELVHQKNAQVVIIRERIVDGSKGEGGRLPGSVSIVREQIPLS